MSLKAERVGAVTRGGGFYLFYILILMSKNINFVEIQIDVDPPVTAATVPIFKLMTVCLPWETICLPLGLSPRADKLS